MDTMTPATTVTAATTTPKSPEPESETPTRIQPAKPISFSNGIIKRHHHNHHHFTYKECLKNHAAALGGHALDGCGEFMPSPSSISSDPTSLKCAACGCHRNFHRREPDNNNNSNDSSSIPPPPSTVSAAIEYQPHHRHHPPPPPAPPRSPNSSSPPPISSSYMLLSLSGTNNNNLAFSDLNFSGNNHHNQIGSRKRFRTKFSQFQKEKMHEFAEKVNWKMQKRDEDDVRDFCRQIGVDKSVLKVWMHNNKNTFNRRDLPFSAVETTEIRKIENGGGGGNHTPISVAGGNELHHHSVSSGGGGGGGGGFDSDSGGGGAHGGNLNGSSSS